MYKMVMYECSCCSFKTDIKQHYQRHEKTKKHQQFVEALEFVGGQISPPTEIERLRLQVKQLQEINSDLRRRLQGN